MSINTNSKGKNFKSLFDPNVKVDPNLEENPRGSFVSRKRNDSEDEQEFLNQE